MLFVRLRINESFEQFAMQVTEVSWDAETWLVFVVVQQQNAKVVITNV